MPARAEMFARDAREVGDVLREERVPACDRSREDLRIGGPGEPELEHRGDTDVRVFECIGQSGLIHLVQEQPQCWSADAVS